MRKYGIAALVVVAIIAIALVVRRQVTDSNAEPAVDTASSVVPADTPLQTLPADSLASVDTIAAATSGGAPTGSQPATGSQPQPTQSSEPRPVVSGHIPPLQDDGAAVLRRAAVAYSNVRSLRADFVQRRENPLLGSSTTSRGTLYQRSPDRFALRFTQPAGDLIIADGQYFWVYYPSVDKRQVIRAQASAGGAGAVDLKAQFIGNPVERFTHTYHGTEKMGGRTVHVLTLVPRQDAGYKSLKVWIDGMDSLVRRFIITEPTGAEVEFQLSNLSVNPNIGNDIFRFTPPADAVIVDR